MLYGYEHIYWNMALKHDAWSGFVQNVRIASKHRLRNLVLMFAFCLRLNYFLSTCDLVGRPCDMIFSSGWPIRNTCFCLGSHLGKKTKYQHSPLDLHSRRVRGELREKSNHVVISGFMRKKTTAEK